jgi:hypothetical protein
VKRRGIFLALFLFIGFSPLAGCAENADVGLPPITISRRTTYVTDPKRDDGFVDLAGAIDRYFSRGVTPETNAAVPLMEAIGPRPMGIALPPEFFQQLGIAAPPADGEYFLRLREYLIAKGMADDSGEYTLALEELSAATHQLWTPEKRPHLAAWLQANERPLAEIASAAKRTKYFMPVVGPEEGAGLRRAQGLVAAQMPQVQTLGDVARAFSARAMLRLEQGDTEGAWADVMTLQRLGRLVAHGPFVVDVMVGTAIAHVAHRAAIIYIEHASPDAKAATQNANVDLKTLPPWPSLAKRIDVSSRIMYVDSLLLMQDPDERAATIIAEFGGEALTIARKNVSHPGFPEIDWDAALAAGHPWYDRAAEALRKPTYRERVQATAGFSRSVDEALKDLIAWAKGVGKSGQRLSEAAAGKYVGELVALVTLDDILALVGLRQRADQWDENLRTALALEAFKDDRGEYPDNLKELVPKYLKEVPKDLFASKPLVYERIVDSYQFYSFGPNGQDNLGMHDGALGKLDDEGVEMPTTWDW